MIPGKKLFQKSCSSGFYLNINKQTSFIYTAGQSWIPFSLYEQTLRVPLFAAPAFMHSLRFTFQFPDMPNCPEDQTHSSTGQPQGRKQKRCAAAFPGAEQRHRITSPCAAMIGLNRWSTSLFCFPRYLYELGPCLCAVSAFIRNMQHASFSSHQISECCLFCKYGQKNKYI